MKKVCLIFFLFAFAFCMMGDGETVYEPPEGYDNAFIFGEISYYEDLGLGEDATIVDADYNPDTGNLVVGVVLHEFDEAPDNEGGKILILDSGDLSVQHTISGAYDWGDAGYSLDRVGVTEDGVIMGMNSVGCVFLVGTEDDDEADGRHLHGPVYLDNDGDQLWGATRNFDVIGNYNDGECVFASGRGNYVRLSQNSPDDVNDFEEITDYDVLEIGENGDNGIVLAQDGSMLYGYDEGIQAYSGSIEDGYEFDDDATEALAGFGFENFIGGDYDAGIIARGGTKGDVKDNEDYGYYYSRVAFSNIHDGDPIGTGNATESGWTALDEGEYWEADDEDNPFPGLYVKIPWPTHNSDAGGFAFAPDEQRAYMAIPGGIVQFHAPDDDPLFIEDWSLFDE